MTFVMGQKMQSSSMGEVQEHNRSDYPIQIQVHWAHVHKELDYHQYCAVMGLPCF